MENENVGLSGKFSEAGVEKESGERNAVTGSDNGSEPEPHVGSGHHVGLSGFWFLEVRDLQPGSVDGSTDPL